MFFPENAKKQADWASLIEHAFEQWEIATYGLVKMIAERDSATGEYAECTDPPTVDTPWWAPPPNPLLMLLGAYDNQINEVMMIDPDTDGEFLTNVFKECIKSANACVTSPQYHGGSANREIRTVDVMFNVDRLAVHYPEIPTDVRFNTCFPTYAHDTYYLYKLAVHEAGHTLGLSDVSFWEGFRQGIGLGNAFNLYKASHPTVSDAVMNYNSRLSEKYIEDGLRPDALRIRSEEDCSPYPFDVMAIRALYQSQ